MEGELLDWEVIHGSDAESTDSIALNNRFSVSNGIDDGILLSDHFSVDNSLVNIPDDQSHDAGMESDDSVRVDYGLELQNPVDLGSQSGDGEVRLSDFDQKHVESEVVAELTGGTVSQYEDASNDMSKLDIPEAVHVENRSAVEEPIEDSSKSWSDSGGNELVSGDSGIVNGEEEIVSDNEVVSTEAIEESNGDTVEDGDVDSAVRCGDESKSRETVWWKMPFVLLKYYAFRIGPVWSVSTAAALMGLVLLGRRLYNMKKKAQRFNVKVTIDDKKVSQVMSQAARLNEVFTEVRRVPVIRPALPSPGAWPVLSLR